MFVFCLCDALTLGLFFFFFWSLYKYVAIENPYRTPTSGRDNPGRAFSALSSVRPSLIVFAHRALSLCTQALSCQLCHDSAVPCRDTISMSRPKLIRDLEY